MKKYKGIIITIDNDDTLSYETNSILKKIINFFLVPILNLLPSGFQKLIKKSHRQTGEVIENATTYKAIEILYNYGYQHESKKLTQKIMHKIWFDFNNSKAIRNRLKLVKRELKKSIDKLSNCQSNINLLSIASGSARAVIEVLSQLKLPNNKIFVKFLDKNNDANKHSQKLARSYLGSNLNNYDLDWITDTISGFSKYYRGQKVDIVEMVGILDYFNDNQVLKTFSLIFDNLSDNGVLITSNISDNKERKFITKIIGWPMIYRTAEDLIELALRAGFDDKKIKVIYEPLKIHGLLIAIK